MKIGILGGTGKAGRALAARLAQGGNEVAIGSRSEQKAKEAADKILKLKENVADNKEIFPDSSVSSGLNADVSLAESIIIATPAEAAVSTVLELAENLRGKLVISMCSRLSRAETGEFFPELVDPEKTAGLSVAEAIQAALPESQITSAFHHLSAKALSRLSDPVENDVLVCADSPDSFSAACRIIESIKSLRALNAGGLKNSIALEAFTAILANLTSSTKNSTSIKITGV